MDKPWNRRRGTAELAENGAGIGGPAFRDPARPKTRLRVSPRDFLGAARNAAELSITLFGLILVTFLIGRTLPIDPILAIVGDKATPDVVARVKTELGLDRSLIEQFWIYLKGLARGDMGTSVMTGQPVLTDILNFFPATMELATFGMIAATAVGVPLGVLAASRQGSVFDNVVRIVTIVGLSVPIFVLGLLGLLVFYVKLDLVPGTGRQDVLFDGFIEERTGFLVIDCLLARDWEALRDVMAHLLLPGLLLAFITFSLIARMTRAFMLDSLRGEHIVAARAKGLSSTRILWRHGFGNIVGKLLTVLALAYAGLLEGAVLTETVFSWPGLGLYLTRSLLNADMNAVLGATLVIGAVYVLLNLLADIGHRLLDPRLSERSGAR